jgi:4-amino-4-deoxy-L-arabinose transferase-like glycosyltransferase
MSRDKGPWLAIALGALTAFAVRLVALGRYVTPDEPVWVLRSIRFAEALAARNWAAVPVTGHPGVTTMWLGALGVAVERLLAPATSQAHLEWLHRLAWLAPENGAAFPHLAYFLPAGRVAVALVTTAGLLLLYLLLRRLVGRRTALVGAALVGFDPFLVGHSGLLHTDALLATFTLLALAAALCALEARARGHSGAPVGWAAAGVCAGLALLTKTPAVVLLGFLLLLCAWDAWRAAQSDGGLAGTRWAQRFVYHLAASGGVALAAALATLFALFPALWADPLGALALLGGYTGQNVRVASDPVVFLGRTTYDPGPTFYPLAAPFRIAPLTVAGLGAGLARWRRLPPERRRGILILVTFALLSTLALTFGAKKYDRYLLPATLAFTLAAVLAAASWAERHAARVVLVQLLLLAPVCAYPLTGFNPLLGGQWGAARVLEADWGEGMGAAARWLNRQSDARSLTVAALSVPSFAPLFAGQTLPLAEASRADYIVTTPRSAAPAHGVLAYRVRVNSLVHALIYTNTAPLAQAAYLAERAGPHDLILLDADTPLARHYSGPAHLLAAPALADGAALAQALAERAAGGHVWLVADPAATPVAAALLRHGLESVGSADVVATVASATVTRYTLEPGATPANVLPAAVFGEHLRLVAAALPETPGMTAVRVGLRWQALGPTPGDLSASLTLRDAAGDSWAEVGGPIVDGTTVPTSYWPPGAWTDQTFEMALPALLPPDTYRVELTVTDGRGGQLGALDGAGQFRGVRFELGDITVLPPQAPAGRPACPNGAALEAGPLVACAEDVSGTALRLSSGDRVTLRLTWWARTPPMDDYRVRWRLLDATGRPALEATGDLSPYPTSRWRAGDAFAARYRLQTDPLLAAGVYTLALNVLDSAGAPVWPADHPLASVEVTARPRAYALPAPLPNPLDVTFGGAATGAPVHLRGFDVSPAALARGGPLTVRLWWQAEGPTDVDYTVFVHLLGPDERPHGQADRLAGGGAAPSSAWATGQVLTDTLTFAVAADAPPGPYRLAVGLYDVASGRRLPALDGDGQPLPDDRAILPATLALAEESE